MWRVGDGGEGVEDLRDAERTRERREGESSVSEDTKEQSGPALSSPIVREHGQLVDVLEATWSLAVEGSPRLGDEDLSPLANVDRS